MGLNLQVQPSFCHLELSEAGVQTNSLSPHLCGLHLGRQVFSHVQIPASSVSFYSLLSIVATNGKCTYGLASASR